MSYPKYHIATNEFHSNGDITFRIQLDPDSQEIIVLTSSLSELISIVRLGMYDGVFPVNHPLAECPIEDRGRFLDAITELEAMLEKE